MLTVTSRITAKDRPVNLTAPSSTPKKSRAELKHLSRPTRLLPTDGIVKKTASKITKGAKTDVEKARAIYEWIVENTFRNPKTRGCGVGDIRFMLESKDLGGKCADLNALLRLGSVRGSLLLGSLHIGLGRTGGRRSVRVYSSLLLYLGVAVILISGLVLVVLIILRIREHPDLLGRRKGRCRCSRDCRSRWCRGRRRTTAIRFCRAR